VRFLDFMSTGSGRVLRIAFGLLLIAVGATAGGGWWLLAAAGLLPLGTGVGDLCPISPFLGRSWRGNTCRPPAAAHPMTHFTAATQHERRPR
jgi:hypothetical protein